MTQIFTSLTQASEGLRSECVNDSLSEEEERFYCSIKGELNNFARSPKPETIEAILKYSKSF